MVGTYTVKKIWNNEKNFAVEMTDGMKITHRKNENFGVVEGQTYEFTYEEKPFNGKVFFNMTGAKPASGGSQSGGSVAAPGNRDRQIMAQVAFKGLVDLVAAGKFDLSKLDAECISNYTDMIELAVKGCDPFASE